MLEMQKRLRCMNVSVIASVKDSVCPAILANCQQCGQSGETGEGGDSQSPELQHCPPRSDSSSPLIHSQNILQSKPQETRIEVNPECEINISLLIYIKHDFWILASLLLFYICKRSVEIGNSVPFVDIWYWLIARLTDWHLDNDLAGTRMSIR